MKEKEGERKETNSKVSGAESVATVSTFEATFVEDESTVIDRKSVKKKCECYDEMGIK